MDSDRRLSLTVGGFVLIALGTLAVAILSLSSQSGVWNPRYELVAYFQNVQGLIPGAPVWLAGTQVGSVRQVAFARNADGTPGVAVTLQVDEAVQDRIRADSVATIGTIGLLGDRYVEVSMGSADARVLEEGDALGSVSPIDFNVLLANGAKALEQVQAIGGEVTELGANLNKLVSDFSQAEGGKKLAESVAALGDIVVEVQEGDGLLHSLIFDQYEGGGVRSIENSLGTLEEILNEVRHGDGIMHALFFDPLTEQDIVLEALEAGSRMNSILAKVDRGEGTFGLLVNDPTLYEDLKALVGGAQRSRVVRSMIQLASDPEQ